MAHNFRIPRTARKQIRELKIKDAIRSFFARRKATSKVSRPGPVEVQSSARIQEVPVERQTIRKGGPRKRKPGKTGLKRRKVVRKLAAARSLAESRRPKPQTKRPEAVRPKTSARSSGGFELCSSRGRFTPGPPPPRPPGPPPDWEGCTRQGCSRLPEGGRKHSRKCARTFVDG